MEYIYDAKNVKITHEISLKTLFHFFQNVTNPSFYLFGQQEQQRHTPKL